ncbi:MULTISPECIES: hypothetical protein [unclassified Crossiella]|uniref:hypothetical protein n=1 Tax=unclassified Crossiella TaxID=2620835 RepID=UPI001FFFC3BF|nr:MULTISPECIES: hypothetical protein [unclassified Crossiella]MCK2240691.1 hypothetical protein [Crossiella sp. S99.2]MCK2252858.1 hypothetical protein [Crossiella sp. S99.1]
MREIKYLDGSLVGLQVTFADGSSLVGSSWADWSLVLELRGDTLMPDYFYPPESFHFSELDSALSAQEGDELRLGEMLSNEGNTLVRIEMTIGQSPIIIRSHAGDIVVEYQ